MEKKQIKSAKDLRVYKKAYALAMEIFNISKLWPADSSPWNYRDRPADGTGVENRCDFSPFDLLNYLRLV